MKLFIFNPINSFLLNSTDLRLQFVDLFLAIIDRFFFSFDQILKVFHFAL